MALVTRTIAVSSLLFLVLAACQPTLAQLQDNIFASTLTDLGLAPEAALRASSPLTGADAIQNYLSLWVPNRAGGVSLGSRVVQSPANAAIAYQQLMQGAQFNLTRRLLSAVNSPSSPGLGIFRTSNANNAADGNPMLPFPVYGYGLPNNQQLTFAAGKGLPPANTATQRDFQTFLQQFNGDLTAQQQAMSDYYAQLQAALAHQQFTDILPQVCSTYGLVSFLNEFSQSLAGANQQPYAELYSLLASYLGAGLMRLPPQAEGYLQIICCEVINAVSAGIETGIDSYNANDGQKVDVNAIVGSVLNSLFDGAATAILAGGSQGNGKKNNNQAGGKASGLGNNNRVTLIGVRTSGAQQEASPPPPKRGQAKQQPPAKKLELPQLPTCDTTTVLSYALGNNRVLASQLQQANRGLQKFVKNIAAQQAKLPQQQTQQQQQQPQQAKSWDQLMQEQAKQKQQEQQQAQQEKVKAAVQVVQQQRQQQQDQVKQMAQLLQQNQNQQQQQNQQKAKLQKMTDQEVQELEQGNKQEQKKQPQQPQKQNQQQKQQSAYAQNLQELQKQLQQQFGGNNANFQKWLQQQWANGNNSNNKGGSNNNLITLQQLQQLIQEQWQQAAGGNTNGGVVGQWSQQQQQQQQPGAAVINLAQLAQLFGLNLAAGANGQQRG